MTLWLLYLLGAPRDPSENMAWQCRHPARVALALATLMSSFFSAFLLARTLKPGVAVRFFAAAWVVFFVVFYVAARINIARRRPTGDAANGGSV
jgi:hypothetical protein